MRRAVVVQESWHHRRSSRKSCVNAQARIYIYIAGAAILLKMPIEDPIRKKISEQLLQKLFNMGIVNKTSSLTAIEKLAVSAFCRRRLPVVMMRLKMSETLVKLNMYVMI